jgi:hypothetical protein
MVIRHTVAGIEAKYCIIGTRLLAVGRTDKTEPIYRQACIGFVNWPGIEGGKWTGSWFTMSGEDMAAYYAAGGALGVAEADNIFLDIV